MGSMSHRPSEETATSPEGDREEGEPGEVGEPAGGVENSCPEDGVEAQGLSTQEVLRAEQEDPSQLQPPGEQPAPVNAPVNSVHVPRFLAITVGVAGLLILLAGLQGAQDIVAPIFLGLNLLIVVYPLQRWMSKRMPRYAAAALALTVVLGVLALFVAMGVWSVAELVSELPHYQDEFARLVDESITGLAALGISTEMVESSLQGVTAGNIMSLVTPILSNVSAIMGLLATLVMGVFFLSMDSATTGRRLTRLAEDRPHIAGAMVDFAQGGAPLLGGDHGLRSDRRVLGRAGAPGHWCAVDLGVGNSGVHHQLHPEYRSGARHDSTGHPGPARRRLGCDARGGRRLQRAELHRAVRDPAQVHRRVRGGYTHHVLLVTDVLVHDSGLARRARGAAGHAVPQGPPGRCGSERSVDQRPDLIPEEGLRAAGLERPARLRCF